MKIGKKIISLVVIASIVPIIIMGISGYKLGIETAYGTAETFYSSIIKTGVSSFDNYFSEVNKKLEFLTQSYAENYDKGINTSKLVEHFAKGEDSFENSYIGTSDKKMITYPIIELPPDYDPTARPWYKDSQGKEFTISEPYEDIISKKFMISIYKEIKKDGQTLGVAAVDVNFGALGKLLKDIPLSKRGFVAVVDKTGLILYHNNKDFMSKKFDEVYNKEIFDNILTKEKSVNDFGGDRFLTLANNISNSSLYLVIGGSEGDIKEGYAAARNINIGLLIFAITVSLVGLIVTNRSIINPINTFSVIFKKGTNGELSEKINLNSKDELELLSKDYNLFVEKLGTTINDIKDLSSKVSSDNEEVAKSIDSLINGSSKEKGIVDLYKDIEHVLDKVRNQTASSEQSLAAAEEINNNGKDIIKNMNNILKDLDNSLTKAKESQNSIKKVGSSIEDITEETKATTIEVDKLYVLSQDIGLILTAITSIAQRTNLLALNAAIESARAGEAGKGFAVVADEIRKLAEQTNQETDKIGKMITSIQTSVDTVKEKGQNMLKKVVDSTILSEESQRAITEIMGITEKNNVEVKALSQAVNDQIYASNEITTAVNHIAENSIEIEELCTNTTHIAANIKTSMNNNLEIIEELKDKSKVLTEDLEFFKV